MKSFVKGYIWILHPYGTLPSHLSPLQTMFLSSVHRVISVAVGKSYFHPSANNISNEETVDDELDASCP